MDVYRQGDVALIRLDAGNRPWVSSTRDAKRVVLAEGEATQHVHVLRSAKTGEEIRVLYQGSNYQDRWGVEVPAGGALFEHSKRGQLTGEHDTLTIPPGRYRIALQNERTTFGVRRAAD